MARIPRLPGGPELYAAVESASRKAREVGHTRPPTKPTSYGPKSIETVTEFVVPYVTVNV
jgi:hypothetical protein